MIVLFGFAVVRLVKYTRNYDRLVKNITSVNKYNMSFKYSMDEMMYSALMGYYKTLEKIYYKFFFNLIQFMVN